MDSNDEETKRRTRTGKRVRVYRHVEHHRSIGNQWDKGSQLCGTSIGLSRVEVIELV
jgi:hypothetical protein